MVTLHLPLTAETRGLFSTALIAKVKPGAYLYNVGRGAIVDPARSLTMLAQPDAAGEHLPVGVDERDRGGRDLGAAAGGGAQCVVPDRELEAV